MVSRWKKIAATLATAALLSVGTQPVLAQEHEHSHDTAAPAQLTLNNGQKWVTDDNLRLGMSRIRDALAKESCDKMETDFNKLVFNAGR